MALLGVLFLLAGCRTAEVGGGVIGDFEDPLPAMREVVVSVGEEMVFPEGELSVEDAVMLALSNNRELSVQRFQPAIDNTFSQIERAEFDPEIFANLAFTDEISSETNRATGGQFSVAGSDEELEVGIRQNFPSGTELTLSASHERNSSNRAPEQQTAIARFRLTQALARGRRPAVNLAAIRRAELGVDASLAELQGYVQAVAANVEVAYWNFALATDEIRIYEESLALAKRQQDEIAQRIDAGDLAKTEAVAARAEIAEREQALIDARSAAAAARMRLLRLLGSKTPDALQRPLSPTSTPQVETAPIDNLADRIALAHKTRPELLEARTRLEQNRLDVVTTRDGLRPRLDFFIEFGRSGFEDSLSGSFEKILDTETYEFSAGVELSQALGRRAAGARHQRAQLERDQAERAVENLREAVTLDVSLAVNEVERARQQIAASAVTRALREETVRVEQDRLTAGAGTALQIAQAQRDLLASQIAETRARVAYRIALIHLYRAEGSLLQRRAISL